jgi:hypothetical protein
VPYLRSPQSSDWRPTFRNSPEAVCTDESLQAILTDALYQNLLAADSKNGLFGRFAEISSTLTSLARMLLTNALVTANCKCDVTVVLGEKNGLMSVINVRQSMLNSHSNIGHDSRPTEGLV